MTRRAAARAPERRPLAFCDRSVAPGRRGPFSKVFDRISTAGDCEPANPCGDGDCLDLGTGVTFSGANGLSIAFWARVQQRSHAHIVSLSSGINGDNIYVATDEPANEHAEFFVNYTRWKNLNKTNNMDGLLLGAWPEDSSMGLPAGVAAR